MNLSNRTRRFVVATPQRSVCDNYARVLEQHGLLSFIALGTRRGVSGLSAERTRLNPWIGLVTYAAARGMGTFRAESLRFRLLPWFDRWVLRQLKPGDHIISSYGYTNRCFQSVRRHGGRTFVDAGNSHIENFWELLNEEHHRWKCPYPPVSRFWYERSRAMLTETDYVFSPSSYVTRSFLERGFKPEQILRSVYPVNLELFKPASMPRPRERPLTIINTGSLSLRKGTPYLLDAFARVRRQVPSARLMLTRDLREDVLPVLSQYREVPIDWSPPALPHEKLASRLQEADVFVLPSLEEGLVRTALEAMACGLQVVLTPNCGTNDFVRSGINGEVVPIRDPEATAQAILACWSRVQSGRQSFDPELAQELSFERFAERFMSHLRNLGLLPVTS